MVDVYIGIGSNLGNKENNIKKAVKLMKEKCDVLKVSSIYKTEPVGYKNQDWFLNCVVKVKTDLTPQQFLIFSRSIEKKLKRTRKIKNYSRTIDLDILFYGKKIIKNKNLIVPHPRMHKRLFVLVPMSEIAPNLSHPKLKKRMKELLITFKDNHAVEFYKKTKNLAAYIA